MILSSNLTKLDINALSGICGSISIACWIVVFTPQILENFRRGSASGLSLAFVIVWLLGDVFNILGAVLQGVLPTMTILAVYYTFADMVLLGQSLYYRGFALKDEGLRGVKAGEEDVTEHSPLLRDEGRPRSSSLLPLGAADARTSLADCLASRDATHLSPATPFAPTDSPFAAYAPHERAASTLRAIFFNALALVVVCAAGALGWLLSAHSSLGQSPHQDYRHRHRFDPFMIVKDQTTAEGIQFDLWGQLFGYLCAILYLVSRIPQLLLNFRRKSTDGVSILFFLFACVGNLTYVMSIFAYEPGCAKMESSLEEGCGEGDWRKGYARYILLNASWLAGSGGTLLLDLGIFIQFWIYRGRGRVNEGPARPAQ